MGDVCVRVGGYQRIGTEHNRRGHLESSILHFAVSGRLVAVTNVLTLKFLFFPLLFMCICKFVHTYVYVCVCGLLVYMAQCLFLLSLFAGR